MPDTSPTCVKCSRPLERARTGRPPRWCGKACRRAAEAEIRRTSKRIAENEERCDQLALNLAQHAAGLKRGAGSQYAARTQTELDHVTAILARDEDRLRTLFVASEGDDSLMV